MKPFTCTAVILCASGLLACAGEVGMISGHPPSNHAFLDMYDRPTARRVPRHSAPQGIEPDQTIQPAQAEAVSEHVTIGGAQPPLRMYSPEWWARERAREQSESERLNAISQICRGC
jgi:hypothetical protein